MKIVVCGKGGSGKSTVSTLIARTLNSRGYNVLMVDADESNVGLHRLMGVSQPVILMDNLGGKKGFKEKLNKAFPRGNADEILGTSMTFDEIPKECVSDVDGIKLLAIGKIHHAGEGCACPIGLLSKAVLSRLTIGEKDMVIIDAEAGVEHFGRGVDAGCDMVLGVVDPTFESFMLAEKMEEMSKNAQKEIAFVLNKVDDRVKEAIDKNLNTDKVVARIPQDNDVFMASLEGKKLETDLAEIVKVCQLLEEKKETVKSTGNMRLL